MAESKSPKLFLLDGSAIAYRSYFAFLKNPLISAKGENTSAAFGFARTLLKIIDDEQPDYLAVVFDTPKPTFRHKMYAEYKATREKMPDDMVDQLPRVRQVIETMGIPILEMPGYEADDIIGTLAKRSEQADFQTYLVTGDKDFMQLVTSKTWIYNLKKISEAPEIYTPDNVKDKMGVPPERVIDLLALMGDQSDNVPGAKGIGPVTAIKLLIEFGSLTELLSRIDEIKKPAQRNSLQENRDLVELSKELVTIDTNVPVELDWESLKYEEKNNKEVFQLFKELEFNSLLERFSSDSVKIVTDYRIVDTLEGVEKLADDLRKAGEFTFDLETTDVDPLRAEIVGFAFSMESGKAFYVPVCDSATTGKTAGLFDDDHDEGKLAIKPVLVRISPLLIDESLKKSGQNIKYDMLVLTNYNIFVKGVNFDTMVASYLVNPDKRQHNLDALALEYFNYTKVPTSDLIGKGKNQITMAEVPVEKVANYACEDADMTQRLKELFLEKLEENNLVELFNKVEIPLINVLLEVERTGVSINEKFLAEMSVRLDKEMKAILKGIEKYAGTAINLNSPKQLSELLFEKMKLPVIKKTKTGYSTDVTVLEELAKQHELPAQILEYRQLTKLQSTYVLALPKLINPRTRRLHTSYNQTVAVTGRLSSSDPNLQNIPIRTELGRQVRKAFVVRNKEHVLVDADYSQIELRVMAHLSQDANLMSAFTSDQDIHQQTAALVFGLSPEEVSSEQRRQAKAINFGIIYGMGPFGLATRLDISQGEAQMFIDSYFLQYPGVKKYIEQTIVDARKKGFVTTLLGRRRALPEIQSDNRRQREFAERTAVNTPIQGTAADLIKVAMINIHRRIMNEKLAMRMIMQVHDELVFEVPKAELDYAQKMIREEMEGAFELTVPLKVDMGVGENWLEAH